LVHDSRRVPALEADDRLGATAPALFGAAIAIRGIAGHHVAGRIGQACFTPGMMKSTDGTGCFAILNTARARSRRATACFPP
jgi:glycerol kinase